MVGLTDDERCSIRNHAGILRKKSGLRKCFQINYIVMQLTKIVVGSDQTVGMWTDPFAAASTVYSNQLSVTTVGWRRRSKFLWTQGRAGVPAVLTRTQLTTIRLEFFAVFVRLAKNNAYLAVLSCNEHSRTSTDYEKMRLHVKTAEIDTKWRVHAPGLYLSHYMSDEMKESAFWRQLRDAVLERWAGILEIN